MRTDRIQNLKKLGRPVLVTGHTGFKGTWLTLLLESLGIEVIGISLEPTHDSLYTRLDRKGKIFEVFLDICDFETTKSNIAQMNPSLIFHLAAQSLVLESYRNPLSTFKTNVIGTANILESVSYLSEKITVVAVTTDKVYENHNTLHKYKENEKLKGKDPYSASKVGTESVVTAWKNIWNVDQSHKICSVRAGNVIGGGDLAKDRLIPDLIRGVTSDHKISIRNPKSNRPWQHVLDPLVGYIYSANALLQGEDFESVNFGPRENSLTVEDVLKIAKMEFADNLTFEINESFNTKVDIESMFLSLDSSFANDRLNWYPKWDQREAITRTFTWWKHVISSEISPDEACEIDITDLLKV